MVTARRLDFPLFGSFFSGRIAPDAVEMGRFLSELHVPVHK